MSETSSNMEDLKDKFEEIIMNEKIAYKCKMCVFHTDYKRSMIVHLKRENPCFLKVRELKCLQCEKIFSSLDNYKKHQNKKKQCTINNNKELILKNYEEEKINILTEENKNIKKENSKTSEEFNDLKKELEFIKNENKILKEKCNNLEEKNINNEKQHNKKYESTYEKLGDIIVDNIERKSSKKKNYLEYYILKELLFIKCKQELNNDNIADIKKKLDYLMEILNEENFDKFFEEIKSKQNNIIPLIKEYAKSLIEREEKGENKKINGMCLKTYSGKIMIKINNI